MGQLKFTTCSPQFMGSIDINEAKTGLPEKPQTSGDFHELLGDRAYIHGEAENLAGYDVPIFYEGDANQLDEALMHQDIIMVLSDREYPMLAFLQPAGDKGAYYLVFKDSEDEGKERRKMKHSPLNIMRSGVKSTRTIILEADERFKKKEYVKHLQTGITSEEFQKMAGEADVILRLLKSKRK